MMDCIIHTDEIALAAVGQGEGGYLHVRQDGVKWVEGGDHNCWAWRVLASDMTEIGSSSGDDEITSPVWDDAPKAMQALVTFLLACAESESEESENYNLFPPAVREWAEMNVEDLRGLDLDLGGY